MLKKIIRKDVSSSFNVLSEESFNDCYETAMKNHVRKFIGNVVRNTCYGLIVLFFIAFLIANSSSLYIPNLLPELESGIHEYEITSISGSGQVHNYIFDERGDVE